MFGIGTVQHEMVYYYKHYEPRMENYYKLALMNPSLTQRYSINKYFYGFMATTGQSLDPNLKREQGRLMLRQWGGRSPIDGRKIKVSSAGYPVESITAHHYAYKAFDPMNYYDCRISALVPIPSDQHLPSGEPHTPLWHHRFRLAKEAIAEGYIPVPIWWDSYPGAYYTTIHGGTPGNEYIGQALASPPQDFWASFWDPANGQTWLFILMNMIPFFYNKWDPDRVTSLDFDNHNLDYHMVTGDLYSYNNKKGYTYVEDPLLLEWFMDLNGEYEVPGSKDKYGNVDYESGPAHAQRYLDEIPYYQYRYNTLGYLQRSAAHWSDGELTTIKPTVNDGIPQYFFSETDEATGLSPLYQPLVVSPERYAELERRNLVYGYLVIDIAPENINSEIGLHTSEMAAQEGEEYAGKVPLADELEGFAYPINDIIVYGYEGETMLGKAYELNATTDYYQPSTNMGNVYLKRPLGELAPLTFKNPSNGHYKLVINISKVVPYEEQYTGIALAQATQYSIMDYFDQYTFASTSAQMIAEIGYTVSITVTSTLISAPSLLLGSYSSVVVNAGSKTISTATAIAMTLLMTFGKLPIMMVSEALEEVIVDSLVETFFESLVRRIGGTAALGHWVSTLMTTLRETKAFGIFTGSGSNTNFDVQVNTEMSV
jgi:hypothetical protein